MESLYRLLSGHWQGLAGWVAEELCIGCYKAVPASLRKHKTPSYKDRVLSSTNLERTHVLVLYDVPSNESNEIVQHNMT